MSQATLSSEPYRNSNLFSGYYLDERVDDLDAWDCDEDASAAFEELQSLWDLERDLVESYKEDELLDSWIDEVLDVLGFGTLSETTLPGDSSGYNDRLLFESADARRGAALKTSPATPRRCTASPARRWRRSSGARTSRSGFRSSGPTATPPTRSGTTSNTRQTICAGAS